MRRQITPLRYLSLGTLIALTTFSAQTFALDIDIHALSEAPIVDGNGHDWQKTPAHNIPVRHTININNTDIQYLTLKAGYYRDRIFFYLRWKDDDPGPIHKPFTWDQKQQRYINSNKREDRLAMQFAISGDYNSDWRSGNTFTADMWHWKSSRSNPLGLAHDKYTIVSRKKIPRAYTLSSHNGDTIYLRRISDQGNPLYSTRRYYEKQQEEMPKYILQPKTAGSIADVEAKGIWNNGIWELEFSRKLDTQHDDDVAFRLQKPIRSGIAIFDNSDDDHHFVSPTISFTLQP